jgi:hypothetical protein
MAFEEDVLDVSFPADSSLASTTANYQYHFVKLSADNTVTIASGATDPVIGVLQNKPQTTGSVARVRIFGVTRVVAAGVIAVNTKVGTDGSGHAVAKTLDTTQYMGVLLEASAGASETPSMLLFGPKTIAG